MEAFEFISGLASIVSLIISLVVENKVYKISNKIDIIINKKISINEDNEGSNLQKATGFGPITQIGHDNYGRDLFEK